MATNTYLEMVRSLRLWVPQLDEFLAQALIRDRYRRILERCTWSGLRSENEFLIQISKTAGTVSVTNNSKSVVGTGTSFAASDVGRTFKGAVGTPIYLITAVDVGLQTLTLDRVFGSITNATSSYTVFDGYVTMPSDFKQMICIVDPTSGYKLRHWVTQDQLLRWDPQRNFFGLPYALVNRRYNAASGTPGIQYELWPYCSTQRNLPFYYYAQAPDLTNDSDVPIWPIRSDVIVSGALADVTRWPGTKDNPNLMYGKMDIFGSYQAEFEDKLIDLERQDEEIYQTWLAQQEWDTWPFTPLSANFIQSHSI